MIQGLLRWKNGESRYDILSLYKSCLEAIKILNDLYQSQKTAEIAIAISDYYTAFDDSEQAIKVLEEYLLRVPTHIQVLDQLASLYLFEGDKEKALEAKFKLSTEK